MSRRASTQFCYVSASSPLKWAWEDLIMVGWAELFEVDGPTSFSIWTLKDGPQLSAMHCFRLSVWGKLCFWHSEVVYKFTRSTKPLWFQCWTKSKSPKSVQEINKVNETARQEKRELPGTGWRCNGWGLCQGHPMRLAAALRFILLAMICPGPVFHMCFRWLETKKRHDSQWPMMLRHLCATNVQSLPWWFLSRVLVPYKFRETDCAKVRGGWHLLLQWREQGGACLFFVSMWGFLRMGAPRKPSASIC